MSSGQFFDVMSRLFLNIIIAFVLPMMIYQGIYVVNPWKNKTVVQLEKELSEMEEQQGEGVSPVQEKLNSIKQQWNTLAASAMAASGVFLVVLGWCIRTSPFGIGLIGGGSLSLACGYMLYFTYLSNKLIFMVLALILIFLCGLLCIKK